MRKCRRAIEAWIQGIAMSVRMCYERALARPTRWGVPCVSFGEILGTVCSNGDCTGQTWAAHRELLCGVFRRSICSRRRRFSKPFEGRQAPIELRRSGTSV
jgi:hypothetical protein